MKKLIYLLILTLIVGLCGCAGLSDNNGTPAANQKAQNESSQNSYETFEREDINTEHSEDAPHDSHLGEHVDATDQALPQEIIGTWRAVEGIPEGLEAYNIIIDTDGNTVQDVETTDGNRSRTVATCIVDGNTYNLVDSNGYLILQLTDEDGKLVTDGLSGGTQTVFEKS